jgi:hypothetical protein
MRNLLLPAVAIIVVLVATMTCTSRVHAQSYYDGDESQGGGGDSYAQDNLYHDYAMRQQEKQVGKGGCVQK